MCGLQSPTSGKVYFKGEDVTKRTADLRRKMGRVVSVVFQDPATALNPRMIVHDQLLDPLLVHKVGSTAEQEKRIKELVELVGLPKSALRAMPGQLSGGQRQRVAIARAMSLNPSAIIADEPTSALDVSVRAQILNLLTDLKKDLGLSMMFISHDIQTAVSRGAYGPRARRLSSRACAKYAFCEPGMIDARRVPGIRIRSTQQWLTNFIVASSRRLSSPTPRTVSSTSPRSSAISTA